MDMQAYKDEILLKLGGSVLDLEIDDSVLEKIINVSFREIQRYMDSTRLATLPYKACMDLSECGVSSVLRVFRTEGVLSAASDSTEGISFVDPMYAAQWAMLSGGSYGVYNQNWIYNYLSYNTYLQIRNTISTDLLFRFDRHTNYLYINNAGNAPSYITIEYVPRYDSVDEIVSDYWIDKLVQLATAQAKVVIGRIRTRYKQSNALWEQDGETLLAEGNEELGTLRQELKDNHNIYYPID